MPSIRNDVTASCCCASCARTFTPSRSDARYCSGACRQAALRQRRRTPEGTRFPQPALPRRPRPGLATLTPGGQLGPPVDVTTTRAALDRVRAVAHRHSLVLRRSPHRWFDLVAPAVDTLLFGSLAVYVARNGSGAEAPVAAVLTGLLLFHVLFQANLALATGFLEEQWSRSMLNLMVTPLRGGEYLLGTALFGLTKVAITMGFIGLAALGFYAVDLTPLALRLLPCALLLVALGWVIALVVVGLVLRFGNGAEVLAWALAFVVWPLSGTFFPIDALPGALQPIAQALPTTHVFDAARAVVDGEPMPWGELAVATVGTAVVAAAGLAYVVHMFDVYKRRGFVTRLS